ncbi:MAG: DUF4038 domain-containing protein [Planctomycetes bacterium]|nr:DUF4038 domain-containing protein [Planctomycetota bacterium]
MLDAMLEHLAIPTATGSALAITLAIARAALGEDVRLEAPREVLRFDPAELRIEVAGPEAKNPFTEVSVTGDFALEGKDGPPVHVEGFCDSRDGALHLLRFSPGEAGEHSYTVRYKSPAAERTFAGRLTVRDGGLPGPVIADPLHPRKLVHAGTRKPFFHLGYTAYHLLDPSNSDSDIEGTIAYCAERGFNKVRFLLTGYPRDPPEAKPRARRVDDGELGVADLTLLPNYGARAGQVNPLPAWEGKPHAYDFERFAVEHWRRAERVVKALRRRGIVATLIVTIEKQDLPKEYGASTPAERLLYRYAVARFAAFDNVWWDLGNEHNEYRDRRWGDAMGAFVLERDPYRRLASAHGYDELLYPRSEWASYAIVQHYGDPKALRDWVLVHREVPKPFINEEYGYEGQGRFKPGSRSGHGMPRDEVRRSHWAIAFGGGYATYGDSVGGAWYYEGTPGPGLAAGQLKHLRALFEELPFNDMEPADEMLKGPALAFALAGGGRIAVYLPQGGEVTVEPAKGTLREARWIDPRTGERKDAAPAAAAGCASTFRAPSAEDWALAASLAAAP